MRSPLADAHWSSRLDYSLLGAVSALSAAVLLLDYRLLRATSALSAILLLFDLFSEIYSARRNNLLRIVPTVDRPVSEVGLSRAEDPPPLQCKNIKKWCRNWHFMHVVMNKSCVSQFCSGSAPPPPPFSQKKASQTNSWLRHSLVGLYFKLRIRNILTFYVSTVPDRFSKRNIYHIRPAYIAYCKNILSNLFAKALWLQA